MFETTDMNLAAYIEIASKHSCELKNDGKKVIFIFQEDVNPFVDQFYSDKDGILSYANKLRNMKSRIINCTK